MNTTPEQNLGKIIKPWEDSSRIEGKTGEFEWWYIDAVGEDGTIVVVYFYRVHVLGGKFTTCDAENPHFHFHLTKAILYDI